MGDLQAVRGSSEDKANPSPARLPKIKKTFYIASMRKCIACLALLVMITACNDNAVKETPAAPAVPDTIAQPATTETDSTAMAPVAAPVEEAAKPTTAPNGVAAPAKPASDRPKAPADQDHHQHLKE